MSLRMTRIVMAALLALLLLPAAANADTVFGSPPPTVTRSPTCPSRWA